MKSTIPTIIIALAIIITAYILGKSFQNRNKQEQSIAVTGLGSKNFVSDLIVWNGTFSKRNETLKDAYAALDADRERIRQYMISKGISQNNMVFSAVEINKEYDESFDERGNRTSSRFTGYRLSQNITVESPEVDKVENISRQVTELINQGIEFYSSTPQYYYTKLAELKIEMIAEATKDANLRAQKIADNAGNDVGSLKKADLGVFQITAQNSAEEYSWGGSFNTSSKRKTATITVKLEYEIE